MTDKNYTADELCRQYMDRAKETLTIAGQRLHLVDVEKDLIEAVAETLRMAQIDIAMAVFQLGRVYQKMHLRIE